MDARRRRWEAIDIFDAGVDAATPDRLLADVDFDPATGTISVGPHRIAATGLRRVLVLGAGKAAERLCLSLVRALVQKGKPAPEISVVALVPQSPQTRPDPIQDELFGADNWKHVETDADGSRVMKREVAWEWKVVGVRPRDANEPTAAAVKTTQRVLKLVRGLGADDLLFCAFTGGGSATLCAPAEGLTLDDKLEAVRLLTADGATIDAINLLRRHLSAVKGGRLAEAASGARAVVSILVSDVEGDDPSVIASGPAVADRTTFQSALDLRDEWPARVRQHLERGVAGELPDTPATRPPNVLAHVILTPSDALFGAYAHARDGGWNVVALPRPTPSDVDACVAAHLEAVRSAPAGSAILSVGETPVTLPQNPPLGGRAGHLAVAIAVAIEADPSLRGRATILVGATDGEDGTSGTAGGVVDSDVLRNAAAEGLDPVRMLERRASLSLLRIGGGTLPAETTGTNVQDLRVILVTRDGEGGETREDVARRS